MFSVWLNILSFLMHWYWSTQSKILISYCHISSSFQVCKSDQRSQISPDFVLFLIFISDSFVKLCIFLSELFLVLWIIKCIWADAVYSNICRWWRCFFLLFYNLVKCNHTAIPLFFPTPVLKELMMITSKKA